MDGWIKIGTKLDTDDFDAQIDYIESQMEEIQYKLKQADLGFEVGDTKKLEAQYEKLGHQLTKLKQKQEALNTVDLSNVQKSIDNIGKSTTKVINKVGKWALAIFGVRAVYGFIRNSVSTLSQYNEKLATDLEYIRYSMASALQPVIEKIINLVFRLLQYINYISMAWFGVNLFANATAENMSRASKSAKEMKKSLAGFDEMNLVGGGTSNASAGGNPSFDLSAPEDVKVPKWLEFIVKNKDLILGVLAGVASGLIAIKLGMGAINALGFGLIITGVTMAVMNLLEYLNKPDWENFGGIIKGLGVVVIGLGAIFLGLPGIIAGVLLAVTGYLIQHQEEVKTKWNQLKDWIYTKIIDPIEKRFGVFGQMITAPIKDAFKTIESYFSHSLKFAKDILDGIIKIFKGDFKGGLIQAGKGIVNQIINLINFMINSINTIISPVRKLITSVGKVMGKNWSMDIVKIPTIRYLKSGGIVNLPGKGVPIGGAYGGEAGKEGVLPLTDSQAMEELGSAIGRYITINLTNNTNLDGKTIARHQSKIQANRNFAMNR